MESERRRRRRHSAEFKHSMVQACSHLGVSVAAVARAHDLNDTVLRRWISEASRSKRSVPAPQQPGFVPVALTPTPQMPSSAIVIEICRGRSSIKLTWPTAAAAECGRWLKDWLQ
jgi:transposase-like protein